VARSANWQDQLDLESVRLMPGSHSSPREGLCAVELASLLGGESLSDRPRCVCRVIAAYMRSLNDRLAHADRQRLVPYAERSVGSRAGRRATHMRRDICLVWAGARLRGGPLRSLLERLAMRLRIWVVVGLRAALHLNEGAGEYAARVVFAKHGTAEAFELLDRLLAVGKPPEAVPAGPSLNGNGSNGAAELEAATLAHMVQGASQTRVPTAIRELAGDAEVAEQENGAQAGNHNGHAGHLNGGDPGKGHEEDIKDDRARDRDPERETKPAEDLHRPARVP
jgi:hypothetical protein